MPDTHSKCGEASARHTPGPWEAARHLGDWVLLDATEDGNGGSIIARFYGPDAEANAKLCAAAPCRMDGPLRRLLDAPGDYDKKRLLQYVRSEMADALTALNQPQGGK